MIGKPLSETIVGWLTLAMAALGPSTSGNTPAGALSPQFEPNASVQAVMEKIAWTVPNNTFDPLTRQHAEELLQVVANDQSELVRQAIYYATEHQKIEGPEADVATRVLLHFHISSAAYVEALVPMLRSDLPSLREKISDALLGADLQNPANSFQVLARYLTKHKKSVPDQFVEVMLRSSPGEALWEVGLEFQTNRVRWRQLIWADHIVADAVWKQEYDFLKPGDVEAALTELDKLSKHEQWWVRRYVAEMLRRHLMFRSEDLVNRLRQDANPFVAESMREVSSPEQPATAPGP